MSRFDDIASALAAADWSNVSIGNKAIILAAIDALGIASRTTAALTRIAESGPNKNWRKSELIHEASAALTSDNGTKS